MNIKRHTLNKIWLCMTFLLSTSTAMAETVKIGDLYYEISDNAAKVIRNQVKNKNNYVPYSLVEVEIPSSVAYDTGGPTPTYIPVTRIDNVAFYNCTQLKSISIPQSITEFGYNAFRDCKALETVEIGSTEEWCEKTFEDLQANPLSNSNCYLVNSQSHERFMSVVIPEGTKKINDYAFYRFPCFNLDIPASVKTIGKYAFAQAGVNEPSSVNLHEGIESIDEGAFQQSAFYYIGELATIYKGGSWMPTSLKTIGNHAFEESQFRCVWFGASLTSIGDYAFCNCLSLQEVAFPYCNQLAVLGNYAFYNCPLEKVELPDHVTSTGWNLFDRIQGETKVYVNKGTSTLLALWQQSRIVPREKGTENLLEPPVATFISSTQSTITVSLDKIYEGYDYYWNQACRYTLDGNQLTIYDLPPGTNWIYLYKEGAYYSLQLGGETKNINPVISAIPSASGIKIKGSYDSGDAPIRGESIYINYGTGYKNIEGSETEISGLDPKTKVNITYYVYVYYGTDGTYYLSYSAQKTVETLAVTLATQQPKVISSGNVIVAAETNLSNDEENVGFEWRRTDWTNDFTSNSGTAYLYEGTMEGYIRNLNTEKLWKYRPYYESASGNRYYGEWVGIDPTNTSYFEPTVHTYASISVNGNTASVRGYAQRGTDNITSQGFKYWPQAAASRSDAPTATGGVPANATTIEVRGTIMETELTGLDYNVSYSYVAFITTSEGETFYGDVRQFTTGPDPTGISGTTTDTETYPMAWFDLHGRRLSAPQRGMNIVRMSDGTSRKIMMR